MHTDHIVDVMKSSKFSTDHFLGISKCDTCSDPDVAECPILLTGFKANEIVWVLRNSLHGLLLGTSEKVPCISSAAMKRLSSSQEARASGGFRDPLKRSGDSLLTLNQDYQAFVLIDDSVKSQVGGVTGGRITPVAYSELSQADRVAAIASPNQSNAGPSEPMGSDSSTQELIDSFDALNPHDEERVQAASPSKLFNFHFFVAIIFLTLLIFLSQTSTEENNPQYIEFHEFNGL